MSCMARLISNYPPMFMVFKLPSMVALPMVMLFIELGRRGMLTGCLL